jgi:glycosyltransferase involved in cell wall biosynthesis
VPIIATNVLGHSEYVSDVGLMISPGSPEEIVSAVTRLVEDDALKKELGAKGRKRAEERLTWEAVAAQTLEVFNKALAGG